LRGAREVAEETRRFAQRARAGAVVLVDGSPGIVIAPHGRPEALLLIGVDADERIRTIEITADAGRIRRAELTLPRRPAQQDHSRIGYQGHRTQPATGPAAGQDREHHAR